MNITADVKLALQMIEQVANGLGSGPVTYPAPYNQSFANGTGANKVQVPFTDARTTVASTPVTYVLSALTDAQGRSIVFAKVRIFALQNQSQTNNLVWYPAASQGWTAPGGTLAAPRTIYPGGIDLIVAPLAAALVVAAGSSDTFVVDPGAAAIPYSLFIGGE